MDKRFWIHALPFIYVLCCVDYSMCDKGVNRKLDMVFIIDESGSVSSSEFQSQQNFFRGLANALYVGENSVNIAAITNSDSARPQFGLTDYMTSSAVSTAISNIVPTGGYSDPYAGLYYAYDLLANYSRSDGFGVIVQATDHSDSSTSWDTNNLKSIMSSAGITTFIYGIQSAYSASLQTIVTQTEFYKYLSTWSALASESTDTIVDGLFPYYCYGLYYMYATPGSLSTQSDGLSGRNFLLTGTVFDIDCCGAVSSVQFYAVNAGTLQFQVWRSNILKAEVDITVSSNQINSVVTYTLPSSEVMAMVTGDNFGWYASGVNPIGYSTCSDTLCPSVTRYASNGNMAVGDSYSWSSAPALSNRAYAVKINAINNTEPTFQVPSATIFFPDHVDIGYSVVDNPFADPDQGEDLVYVFSDNYFDLDLTTDRIVVKSALPHTGMEIIHTLVTIVTDTCENVITGTVTVTTFNESPQFQNLPDEAKVFSNTTEKTLLFTILTIDEANDPITCVLAAVLPEDDKFRLEDTGTGTTYLYSKDDPDFIYDLIPEYRLTIACSDGVTNATNSITVRVVDTTPTTPYVLPSFIMTGLTTSVASAAVIMILICFLLVTILVTTDEAEVKTELGASVFGNDKDRFIIKFGRKIRIPGRILRRKGERVPLFETMHQTLYYHNFMWPSFENPPETEKSGFNSPESRENSFYSDRAPTRNAATPSKLSIGFIDKEKSSVSITPRRERSTVSNTRASSRSRETNPPTKQRVSSPMTDMGRVITSPPPIYAFQAYNTNNNATRGRNNKRQTYNSRGQPLSIVDINEDEPKPENDQGTNNMLF